MGLGQSNIDRFARRSTRVVIVPMPSPPCRPLLYSVLALTFIAAIALLLTVVAIEQADPNELAAFFAAQSESK